MSTLPTVTIQTGPDTFITVNESDYDSFKFMEYVPKVTKKHEPVISELTPEPEVVVTKKRTSIGE